MRITILPKTHLGRWSVSLAAAIILVGISTGLLVGLTGHELQNGSVGLMTFGIFVSILVIGSIVTGILGITKSKERSALVFAVVVLGFFVLIFLPGFWVPGWG